MQIVACGHTYAYSLLRYVTRYGDAELPTMGVDI
jgi:hypothetical protein